MSMMSHLSVDPAQLAQISMMQGHYNGNFHVPNLDQSQFASVSPETAQLNEDRMQIVQWHLSQIAEAKEQIEEAERQLAR